MTKERVFGIIGLILLSIWIIYTYVDNNYPFEPEKIVNLITRETGKKLRKDHELHLIGNGGSMLDNDIKMLFMGFDYFQPVDISSGRILLVAALEDCLSAINSNERIRPYLNVYPFTEKNIEIEIFIRRPDRGTVSSDQISFIGARNGILTYERATKKYPPIIVHKETYEEAVQKMK